MSKYVIRDGRRYIKEGSLLSVELKRCLFDCSTEMRMNATTYKVPFPAFLVMDLRNQRAYWQSNDPILPEGEELVWWLFQDKPTMLQANKMYNSLVA